MNNINITFEYDDKTIREFLEMGALESDETSQEFLINIRHNSNRPIRECSFFLSPYSQIYNGSNTANEDFKKIIWYGDNYENYGLSIDQEYTVFGEIYIQEASRLIDITRTEDVDFFKGSMLEIISGPLTGEVQEIRSFDPQNSLFQLVGDFSGPVNGERYKIEIKKTNYIKSRSGTSVDYPIQLLHNGGTINRFDIATIKMKLKIPPFMKSAGISLLNFNMKYTPEE
ncbi:MAG: hypothetical protein PHY47_00285 [Lachnospiraceae bacterium]|nr:hypothetical protein [Lachnospiraceae bacterium]